MNSRDGSTSTLVDLNGIRVEYPHDKLVHELIAEQARAHPDRVAIACGEQAMSYAELAGRVRSLAWRLRRDHGVRRDTLVALLMERSFEMVVGMLAILEAGGAYVPIDPLSPAARILFILRDCRADLLLANVDLDPSLEGAAQVLDLRHAEIRPQSAAPSRESGRDSLIYCLYTSGSSGEPKGVLVEHGGVLNVLQWARDFLAIDAGDRVLQKSTYTFDVSVLELFAPLMTAARLVLLPRGAERSPASIRETVLEQCVTVVQFVPSALAAYLASVEDDPLPGVKRCICAGEPLRPSLRTAFYNATAGQCALYNLYGPTEASIYATACLVERGNGPVTIGRPIANTRLCILDTEDRLCLPGEPGEICIAGIAVARGYLNRSEQSREKFVADPFAAGERLYRTGDLGLWRDNGEIEYLGRRDHQVKIRGYRIELGEVENALSRLDGVDDAAVIAAELNGERELVAYWVGDERTSAASLREGLRRALPAYMVPSRFIWLDAFPMNANGKIQRSALPAPDLGNVDASSLAPLDAFGGGLCSIYEEVLGLRRVDLNERFLDLGGDSLKAARIALLIRRRLERDVDIEPLLRNESIAELAARLSLDSAGAAPAIEPAPPADWYPLSSGQLALWLVEQGGVPHPAYAVASVYELNGALDTDALRRAAELLLSRHESLRTAIHELEGVPMQRAVASGLDWSFGSVAADARGVKRRLLDFFALDFALSAGLLLRFLLLERSPVQHLFAVSMHHIATDGWSLTVLIDEILSAYASLAPGGQPGNPAPALQYKDYSCWQQRLLEQGACNESRSYWLRKLAGADRLELPADRPRPAVNSFRGAVARRTIAREALDALKALCRRKHVTLYAGLCALLRSLFFRYTGQRDFVLGTSALGRSVPELRDQIGYFVNTLALRDSIAPEMPFRALLQAVQSTLLEAIRHQNYPFHLVIHDAGMAVGVDRNPLFDVMMMVDAGWGDPTARADGLHGLEIRHLEEPREYSKLDMTVVFKETAAGLRASIEYSTDLFAADRIERMLEHFATLLSAAVDDPGARIDALRLLSAEERHHLLDELNDTHAEAEDRQGRQDTVHELFERQVRRTPHRVATISDHQTLTFAQLNARANALAWRLRGEHGVGPEALVGILMDRSVEMMIGILAVMKAGGAYLALSLHDPAERIDSILRDSGSRVVLTRGRPSDGLRREGRAILDLLSSDSFAARDDNPPALAQPGNLIYCIYTSGSTGKPKGALIEHRPVVNRLSWMIRDLGLDETDVILQKTPHVFDVSVWELLLPGMIGARQVLLQAGGESDPGAIRDAIQRHGVTTVHFVPSMLSHYLAAFENGFRGVKRCICSGEELGKELARRFFAAQGDAPARLYNYYGPTEATVDVSFQRIEDDREPVSIGRPAANTSLYILDAAGNACPLGVTGELCIGGVQVGRGYLNCPEMTAERFTADPFRPGERMYHTGDLARWRRGGEILYEGRRDRQIKMRGFRIELGEIEQALCLQAGIARAVVVLQRDDAGTDFLCAYVEGPACPPPDQMRDHLAARLPEYMVPSHYVRTGAIPVTRNGKVDRNVLVRLDLASVGTRRYVAPRNEIEQELAAIWQSLLPVGRLGVEDDFFAVGGNSLSALQLSSRIRSRFGIPVKLASIFRHRTVADQVRLIAEAPAVPSGAEPALRPYRRRERHALSFAQERIWFLCMLSPESAAYHIPTLARLGGRLDAGAMERAIQHLVDRHEMLRVTFVNSGERVFQVPRADLPVSFEMRDLSGMDDGEAREMVRRAAREASRKVFRLHAEAPFRSILFRLSDTEHYLLVVLHHIAGDGWSIRLILREISLLYMQEIGGPVAPLPPLPVQYIDYAEAMREHDHREAVGRDLRYWVDRLAECPSLELPGDVSGVPGSGHVSLKVSPATCEKMKDLSRKTGTTLFEITMAALNLLLSRLSDQQDVVVGFPVANRQSVELESIVGLFLNTLVLRTDLSGRPSFEELLRLVSVGIREAFEHQAAPFELLVERLNPERHLDRTPLYSVLLNFQSDMREEISIEGVSAEFGDIFDYEAKLALAFYVQQDDDGLDVDLVYRSGLFSAPRAQMMIQQLADLLGQAAGAPDRTIASFSLIPPGAEAIFPDLDHPLPEPACPPVTELIAERAAALPDRVAVAQGANAISYADLVRRSEDIARYLAWQDCGTGDVVVVTGPRGIGFVAALLGVLRSGAIVFPLDATLPEERRRRLMGIGNAKMMIHTGGEDGGPADPSASDLPFGLPALRIAARTGLPRTAFPAGVERTALHPVAAQSPAYLFFTSGTTGVPRGVLGRHAALSHFLLWQSRSFGIIPDDRCAQLTSPSFDVMLRDTFLALVSGGTLVVPEEADALSGRSILGWLEKERLTVLHAVPTLLQSWLLDAPAGSRLPSLRWIFLAGEPLKASLVESFRAKCPGSGDIVNLYGPTETTLAKFFYLVPRGPLPPVLPVGRPLPQCQGLVMRDDVPCGVGEPGEIIIRTPFRTFGYFDDPAASRAAFYPNPRRDDEQDLLYRTGDLGRFRPDGVLEILGRKDLQLKIRGVRVEPAEIEESLSCHPSVQACIVVPHQDPHGEAHLVAYVVARGGEPACADRLRAYLAGLLPLPMVPLEYILVDHIPTTPNGKPDRKALPRPRFTRDETPVTCEMPRNDAERSIQEVWQAVFDRAQIGVTANFFDIGGTSLKLLRLFALLEERFPGKFRVALLFTNPTIASQAALVRPGYADRENEVVEIDF